MIKKSILILFMLLGLFATYYYRENIIRFVLDKVVSMTEVKLDSSNEYYLSYNFNYVNPLNEFEIHNKKDLLNLYYTIINNGETEFKFYCPSDYEGCINDVVSLANNQKELSNINAFVHPYNSFDQVETVYDSLGRVDLSIIKTYDDEIIKILNDKVEEIIKSEIKENYTDREKIKAIHDYIINHTVYDKDRTDNNIIKYNSNTAYGVIFEGYGICSGYSDTMSIFLNHFNIPNFKVTSENHVWNAVYLDGKWYHLDLTWDDPILSNGENTLIDTYFLITTSELMELNDSQHNFDTSIFSELA